MQWVSVGDLKGCRVAETQKNGLSEATTKTTMAEAQENWLNKESAKKTMAEHRNDKETNG